MTAVAGAGGQTAGPPGAQRKDRDHAALFSTGKI